MLENLNPQQRLAVETTEGPLLVLSGAGTGKTRVLTTRVAYIISKNLAMPWQVLALTFTNRAANEMKTRILSLLDGMVEMRDLWCGTFHSICLRILRANAAAAGLRPDFVVYGDDDQRAVLKSIFASMGGDARDFNVGDWIERISAIKDKGLVHGDYAASPVARKIFDAYNDELARVGAVDFGDIILRVLRMFENTPDVLERYRQKFKYIMVDEFQDTNAAQMQLLKMLTDGTDAPNICCVGDDDQSIYSWRGAEIKNILGFERTFPGATIIRLETNYRSTPSILGAANSLIRQNQGRLGKDLRAGNGSAGCEPVYVMTVPTDRDEARIIADTIERFADGNYCDFAILIRAGNLSRLFEEELARRAIPYRLVGATKFYDRAEIRDAIAYLRLLAHPFDDVSFIRAISRPRRGIGDAAIGKIRAAGPNMMMGLKNAVLTKRQRDAADEFLAAFNFDWDAMAPADAAQQLLDNAGYIKYWRQSSDPDADERINNIRDLIRNVISKYDTLDEFLEHAALMTAEDDNDGAGAMNAVGIMTIHAAKGLEFSTVFLPAWEEGIFPNDLAVNGGAIEEERRLAYVAITRARRRAIITNTMMRWVFGEQKYNGPSRFLSEMDPAFLEFQGAAQPCRQNSRSMYGAVQTSYGMRRATPRAPRAPDKKSSMVGKLVEHREMGTGVVIEDGGEILTVAFKGRGIKKIARGYITTKDF